MPGKHGTNWSTSLSLLSQLNNPALPGCRAELRHLLAEGLVVEPSLEVSEARGLKVIFRTELYLERQDQVQLVGWRSDDVSSSGMTLATWA